MDPLPKSVNFHKILIGVLIIGTLGTGTYLVTKLLSPSAPVSTAPITFSYTQAPSEFINGKFGSLTDSSVIVDGKDYPLGEPVSFGWYKADPGVIFDKILLSETLSKIAYTRVDKEFIQPGDSVQIFNIDNLTPYPEAKKAGVVSVVVFKQEPK
ncbi:MAG: hypothetical protein A3F33_02075 [Candidatus Woykebacteria bacterium RIFCSPHIGHO2_12_FULL_43_10]|uniref:Uncharacterized protein n=1 Tax=Candidatus Woykebacteria bacterium RIFCSPHIGHO2_02_FULL_43_16b TaxID=1802601 RepID=A0A1G1WMQ5_9BACT|nr:MAG: hypothetical protein A2802_01270 [Candidatus Woykebacteria bacterium RIFCSPHIGHO2_01_FULL_43_29]OGY28996.1 MAG: hypothetical protein A3J50_03855 [Candidatus Woykebacteria bacterium RIFCSPHIGHO2_02_FULL_43_16b]OGY29605.1 MAG: hypothetical protein A3F33_02075 [Candidatus Woykebacteria bacterium RIFCSPHIGHO2_12_FULL_43_10]